MQFFTTQTNQTTRVTVPFWTVLLTGTVIMTVCAPIAVAAVRAVVVFPLALLVPGAALLMCLRLPTAREDAIPRIALSALLSVGFYALLSLLLYALSVRLSTGSVLVGTDLFVVTLTAIVFRYQSTHLPALNRRSIVPVDVSWSLAPAWRRNGALFVLGSALSLVCLLLAIHALPASPTSPYTAFSLAGSSAGTHVTTAVSPGGALSITVAVANHTGNRQHYVAAASMQAGPAWHTVGLQVESNRSWQGQVRGNAPTRKGTYRLAVSLMAGTTRLATLTSWIRVT